MFGNEGFINLHLTTRSLLVGESYFHKGDICLVRAIYDDKYSEYNGREEEIFRTKWKPSEAETYASFKIKSNVWLLCVLLKEIVAENRTPYPEITAEEVSAEVELGHRMPCLLGHPLPLYNLMLICLVKNPKERPTFEHLIYPSIRP